NDRRDGRGGRLRTRRRLGRIACAPRSFAVAAIHRHFFPLHPRPGSTSPRGARTRGPAAFKGVVTSVIGQTRAKKITAPASAWVSVLTPRLSVPASLQRHKAPTVGHGHYRNGRAAVQTNSVAAGILVQACKSDNAQSGRRSN